MNPRLENAGLEAWLVRFADGIDPRLLPRISAFCRDCRSAFGESLVDLVPSYTTVLVQYDPWRLSDTRARQLIERVPLSWFLIPKRVAGALWRCPYGTT